MLFKKLVRPAKRRGPTRLHLEALESRCVPATLVWIGAAVGDGFNKDNWENQANVPCL